MSTSCDHPSQLCWGFVLAVEEQGRRCGQSVFGFLADCARPAVLTVKEVFAEIEREAVEAVTLGDEYIADGRIDQKEWAALRRRLVEMGEEARDERVIKGRAA